MGIAEKIATALIERKLAACVNFLPSKSIYRWKGKIERNEEVILFMKIWSADFDLVAKEIVSMHPYEVPCIVKYDIADGYRPYLDWIKESTDRSPED